ncbi:MAG: aminopeptidase [Thermoplasmata archaeon]|nr:aminopeptidase [Thermoplasmata archaeon]
MSDPESNLARAVLAQNLKVKNGESVVIEAWAHSLPYVRAFVREIRRLGAYPTVLYEDEGAWWDAVESKKFGSFAKLSKVEHDVVASADVYLFFWGPDDRPRLWGLPEATDARMTGYNDEWYKLAEKTGLRGCRMSVGQASDRAARFYGLNGKAWRARLLAAGAETASVMRTKGERVSKALKSGKELRIRHANGTDLTLRLRGVHTRLEVGEVSKESMKRPFGMLTTNPTGQLMVGIDDSAASGDFVSNRTVYLGQHRYSGIRWSFESGRLSAHQLTEGKKVFETNFNKAGTGKDVLGFLTIGLNPSSRDLAPCEDTEEGSVMLGIGNNAAAGGKIRIPFQSYALLGEAKIEVDGRTIADGGRML